VNHIFGPVPSRRLGLSLGIDVIPKKICTLDCVYCEVGRTTRSVVARKEYVPADAIMKELRETLSRESSIDSISFSGSGEPTLNSKLGEMIHGVKKMTGIPVAVITNGTLLSLPDVRRDLLEADAVLPSLNAASDPVFKQIDRPHHSLRIGRIIEGLQQFRRMYRGQIWLEVLLVEGINDRDEEICRLREAIGTIDPDKVQLNTVVRPPADAAAHPVGLRRMEEIRRMLGGRCEIIASFERAAAPVPAAPFDAGSVLGLIQRRPATLSEIAEVFCVETQAVLPLLDELENLGLAEQVAFDGLVYYLHRGKDRLSA
jgi:wyosine [tRNA(Phe)-imidazoG37] synthetase (radical SAM superfamily)